MLVTVEDGRATKIAGDPDHPVTAGFLCGKVSNYLDRVYSPDRILHPLVREGAKGEGRFRPAPWDEALDLVAARLDVTIERYGGEAVLPYSFLGAQGFLQCDSMSARVMHAIGASTLDRTICDAAAMVGVAITHGESPEVDPEEWPNARYLLLVGWNPMSTAPHLWRLLLEARRNGARLVVVDPYRSRTARVADEHIRPLPGTDGAFALGLMRAIVDEGLQDEEWCRAQTLGYDELLARLEEYPVERCASLCDVPADAIRRVGHEFATTQPSLLRLGVGGQHHAGAEMAYRTLACLPALAGSWRHRGGGFAYSPLATFLAVDQNALQRADLRRGVRTINMAQLGDALTDPALDPPVAALVVWNANPAVIAPDQTAVLRGLAREDLFTVVLEQFPTDTVRYADVVLPATTQLEHLDVVPSWGHHHLTYNEPAVTPLGEAKPNTEIFRLLAMRLGLDDPCFAETDEELLEALFATNAPGGVTLARLRADGHAKIDFGQGARPHANGGFPTPSGKLELLAPALRDRDVDPLPFFDPPAEVLDPDLAERYPLCLVTPKTHLFLNSTFANQRKQSAAQPGPFLVLHPDDASARGVTDERPVRVFNDRGSFVAVARVSGDVRAGVAVAPMGWWNTSWPDGIACQATTPQRVTPLGGSPTFNDNRVEVELVGRKEAPEREA
jgi:anaerobic selenocysteine-containing dehydrogenase